MTQNDIWVVYSTFPSLDEAFSAANALVEKRLIACANLLENVTSVYRWQGGIQREKEVVMIAKTSQPKVREAIRMLTELHPYQIPAITAYPAPEGHAAFMQWVADETTDA